MVTDITEQKELQKYIADVEIGNVTKGAILDQFEDIESDLEKTIIENFEIKEGRAIFTSDFNADKKEIHEFVSIYGSDNETRLYEIYRDASKIKDGAEQVFGEKESEDWKKLADTFFGEPYIILTKGKDAYASAQLSKHGKYALKKLIAESGEQIDFLLEINKKTKSYTAYKLNWKSVQEEQKVTLP